MGGRPDAESNQGPHVGWLRAGPGRPWEELCGAVPTSRAGCGPCSPTADASAVLICWSCRKDGTQDADQASGAGPMPAVED